MIRRAVIKNYKGLQSADVEFGDSLNILVGNNEAGKSTLLEAINLALTGQLNRRSAAYELHPFLFHQKATSDYLAALASAQDSAVSPPEILIEIYLEDKDEYAELKGQNNTRFENCPGVKLRIAFDQQFAEEYAACLIEKDRIRMLPVEYFGVFWESFANERLDIRRMPVRPVLIDPASITGTYAANKYIVDIARDFLSAKQQAALGLTYRSMRDVFRDDQSIVAINEQLALEKGIVSEKPLSIALDMTAKANWETSIQPHLDNLPLSQIGKGEQSAIKIKLALRSNEDRQIILIEEPENHLSHTNLGKLINEIKSRSVGKQLIISTHSSFVLNKLGIENALMFNGSTALRISDLDPDTADYFVKLPGHDTLRMVLARRSILVEGPSDELIVLKAYQETHGKTPFEDGVELIAVNSLAFKRFLDIAKSLNLRVSVVTDNDGDHSKLAEKYEDYVKNENIRIFFSLDNNLPTLEPQLLSTNGLETLNKMLNRSDADDESSLKWMKANKTETALKILQTVEKFIIPDYIADAIAE